MSVTTAASMPARDRLALVILSAFAAGCMLAAALMTMQVLGKLDEYGSAKQDNLQWTMSQLEVDQLRFRLSLERLNVSDPASIENVRRQFDLLYSRAMTLQRGEVYRTVIRDGAMEDDLNLMVALLAQMVPIIDAPDTDLHAASDRLAALAGRMTAPIRAVATQAITVDARRSDAERTVLTSQIITLTILILLMVTALFTLLITLWRLYRSHRLRAEESRRTSNRLATILNTSQDAVLVIDADGGIRDTNASAKRMFDLPNTPESDLRLVRLISSPDGDAAGLRLDAERLMAACRDGPYRSDRLTGHSMTGRHFAVELSADLAPRGDTAVCICFVRDISARRAAEAEIATSRDRALSGERAKARFLGMISHEMRTPLNGILGALDLLGDTGLDAEQERYTRIMRSSGQLLLTQITDALDMTQAEAGKLRLRRGFFDLNVLLTDLVESQSAAAAARGNRMRLLSLPDGLGMVEGDRDRVHQVLLNLVSNAIKFTRDGDITLEVSCDCATDMIEFQVSDTGVGISETDLPHVFDDFMRAEPQGTEQPEGTGLGLGIARQIATLMGGSVGAESVLGEGSVFWVRLPLRPSDQTALPLSSDMPNPVPTHKAHVLVVEDNPTNRVVVETMLTRDGHQVSLAADGIEGVDAAQASAFDLILMDVNMPRLDGIAAVKAIRAGDGPCARTRIVALTAHAGAETARRLIEAGVDTVETKPLSRKALRRLVAGFPTEGNTADRLHPRQNDSSRACLDHSCLEQLRHMLPTERVSEILRSFEAEGDALMGDLSGVPTLPDDALVARLHQLAGTAATCGARALHQHLAATEAAVLRRDDAARATRLAELPRIWQVTLAEIDRYRDAG